MSAFEFKREDERIQTIGESADLKSAPNDKIRQECIIANKVYDRCRQQYCLTPDELGPTIAAENVCIDGQHIEEGEVIIPPASAVSVSIENLKVKKIVVVNKKENEFRKGFWDIDLKYVFEYKLIFRETDHIIGSVKAASVFTKRVTLFGSTGSDLVIATDLMHHRHHESKTMDAEPFVMVEAKAIPLEATISSRRHRRGAEPEGHRHREVLVTIGLFAVVKIFRIVDLFVESKGFLIPKECEDISPLNPCDFFDNLDFPIDIFAPPHKKDFKPSAAAGFPRLKESEEDCDC
ncbi:MAG: hypothetical protein FWE29_04075 [Defluviitaleaceae bacterium]|nr:hypothetical protein [Defluviitaleaceae bacterium]